VPGQIAPGKHIILLISTPDRGIGVNGKLVIYSS
jgi:hypothetical protein